MFRLITMTALAAMAAAIQVPSSAQIPPLTAVMQEKAENAERLLKSVVLGDFVGIDRYAERPRRLT